MTFNPRRIDETDPIHFSTMDLQSFGSLYHSGRIGAPASAVWNAANRAALMPFFLRRSFSLARWMWLNGATAGTDYIQTGIYDDNNNLVACSPRILSANTNVVQYQTPGPSARNVTASGSSTDGAQFTTASVTLRAGFMYLLAVENSKASAAEAVSSIDSATAGLPTFTSRSTTTFNASTANRVSIFSCVPTVDWTGTIRINFAGTQTGACWSLNELSHIDTTTNDGVVQNVTGTGSSTTPLATLAALGSAENLCFAAFGQAANATGAPTSATTFELSDAGTSTPAQALQTDYTYNDTTMDETITSAQWGACAVEMKSLGTGAITIPAMRGLLALWVSGTTATIFRINDARLAPYSYLHSGLTSGLPAAITPASSGGVGYAYGFTSRATV